MSGEEHGDCGRGTPPASDGAAVARGRSLLAALGIRDAPPALAALADAVHAAARAFALPPLDVADELTWVELDARPRDAMTAVSTALALELCEATPALARRLPAERRARADAARFELEETLDAIARRALFARLGR